MDRSRNTLIDLIEIDTMRVPAGVEVTRLVVRGDEDSR